MGGFFNLGTIRCHPVINCRNFKPVSQCLLHRCSNNKGVIVNVNLTIISSCNKIVLQIESINVFFF